MKQFKTEILKRLKDFYRIYSVRKRPLSPFFRLGFHGDLYLLKLVDLIIQRCTYFIETGTNVGSSLSYIARTYPFIKCIGCEPDRNAYKEAIENTRFLPNVAVYNETSKQFMKRLEKEYCHIFNDNQSLFWLDAHGNGYEWPLKREIKFITDHFNAASIFIDDFKVIGLNCFGYNSYDGQECSFAYIKDSLNPNLEYKLYYPTYTEKTSKHHPLRGWGLIEYGNKEDLILSDILKNKVQYEIIDSKQD